MALLVALIKWWLIVMIWVVVAIWALDKIGIGILGGDQPTDPTLDRRAREFKLPLDHS